MAEQQSETLGNEYVDKQGRLVVPMTCFFDKAPTRDDWRVVWSETTGDRKWPRVYFYKKIIKSEIKEDENAAIRVEGAVAEDE